MAQSIQRGDLLSLEDYHERRPEMRREVLAHKASRQVAIGDHATLYFEDRLTIQYQIQEMLRIERIFESQAVEEELAAYNPLIPDGDNLKATFMLEYEDINERRAALSLLKGIEDCVWVRTGDHDKVYALADEDLDRSNEDKTSAVHFLRFQMSPAMVEAAQAGEAIAFGIDHEHYRLSVDPVSEATRANLARDFD